MYKFEVVRAVLLTISLLAALAETCPYGCTCPSYRKVGCFNASLTLVPHDIDDDVITLDLSHNAITELDQDSFKTYRLRYLFLNNNCIRSVFKTTFWSLPELQNLFLNSNRITHIDHLTFLYSSKLKELDLSQNQLTSLSESTFTYTTSLMLLNLSGNRLTSLQFVVPMTTDQSFSKRLTLQAANNTLKHLGKETLRSLGRFMKFDISNNTGLLCPCHGRHHPCSEYTQNWNEYLILCLQKDEPLDFYHHVPTHPYTFKKPTTTTAIESRLSTTTYIPTTKTLKVENTKENALERTTVASLSELELTIVIATLSVILVVATVVYFVVRSRLQNQEDSPSQMKRDLEQTQSDHGASDRPTSYAELDEGLKRNLLPYRLHLVTPTELNEPLYQVESVGSFIYTPPSEVYFDFGAMSNRQLPSNAFYLDRGFSLDATTYDPGIYTYDHIYEEIK